MLKLLLVDEDPATTPEDLGEGNTPSRTGMGRLESKHAVQRRDLISPHIW